MNTLPETREDYSSKIPAIKTLMALGWQYLSATECMARRGGNNEVLLRDALIEHLKAHQFEYKGQWHSLSTNAIDQIVRDVSASGLQDGLLVANERIYDKLCLGITVTEFVEGQKHQPTVPLIDWRNPANNTFHVTEELEVLNTQGTMTRRPDVVCYVNGIPLVVIEAKRPDSGNPNKNMVAEGISQTIRNQKQDEIPELFAYSQLLLAISNTDGRYGTTKTPDKFWASWREEEFDEEHFVAVKNTALSTAQIDHLFADKKPDINAHFQALWSKPELPTEQDRLLISLLTPDRLMEFIRYFIIYDKKVGKIAARYQQVFGVKALIDRINHRNRDGGREGGVIWHTTGSGKSFTMVFLTKSLLLHDSLKECRVLVVTDRTDLEKQLSNTFVAAGVFGSDIGTKKEGQRTRATTGKDLARRIGKGQERIIFSLIQKFTTATKQPECFNPSDNLIVLIDEGHRSQGGENHERMRKALPKAAYIAFTGTPLLKDYKTTNKFGPIVHAYTMQKAVQDKTVTPLLYEERQPVLDMNEDAIDNWFERITMSLSPEQQRDLKKKYTSKGQVYGAENRIELIAWDIAAHFKQNFKDLNMGLKGQIATDSKLAAIRYKKALDATGLVSSAVVISPPDTREGHSDVDETTLPEVQQWWKDHVAGDADEYERGIIEDFATDGAPDLLIVVDKLLTGFDEPKNAVLYIDKPLKQHNLIQAIARVNRLHSAKQYGLLIDYRGILKELDTAIADYQDLEQLTQGGYDIEDLTGLYADVNTEYKKLPSLNERLWAIFKGIENTLDLEQYRQVLMPKYVPDADGEDFDERQSLREDFYQALTQYGLCLKIALSTRSLFEDASFNEEMIEKYKADLRWFTNLRKIVGRDAQETVDYTAYEAQIRNLVDKHVVGSRIIEPPGVIDVHSLGEEFDPDKASADKLRNETDTIKTRLKKTIEQDLNNDPYAQKVFSELLKQAIQEAEALFDHPYKQYILFSELEEKVKQGQVDEIAEDFGEYFHAGAYFGIFKMVLGEDGMQDHQRFVDEAYATDEIVKTAVAENSLNPQNIEAQIRQKLLPRLFGLIGLDAAKTVIDQIVGIARSGVGK